MNPVLSILHVMYLGKLWKNMQVLELELDIWAGDKDVYIISLLRVAETKSWQKYLGKVWFVVIAKDGVLRAIRMGWWGTG